MLNGYPDPTLPVKRPSVKVFLISELIIHGLLEEREECSVRRREPRLHVANVLSIRHNCRSCSDHPTPRGSDPAVHRSSELS